MIDYDHRRNLHTVSGAASTLEIAFRSGPPKSVLDVGCGTGTWLRAATDLGVAKAIGVDGIALPDDVLKVSRDAIKLIDLTLPFNLGERFDMAICLEVGEHLPEACAAQLVSTIVAHTDVVLFSAACPGQPGQHHINCQWPSYWQGHFNRFGFVCDDSIRWEIWDDSQIEPWYRQNMFWARRDSAKAGQEPRLKSVIHPDFMEGMCHTFVAQGKRSIEAGSESVTWYAVTVARATLSKLVRRLSPKRF
jgi:SAM-dependent methyltransferase